MALVVEDGTGLTNADAYISLADVDTYHTNRGHTRWTGTNAVKETCIRRATDYVDKRFGTRFRGYRKDSDQSLEWPRTQAYDRAGRTVLLVPVNLQRAVAEYALRALLLGELAPDAPLPVPEQNQDVSSTPSTEVVTGEIKSKTERVGPIEESTTYATSNESQSRLADRASQSAIVETSILPQYPAADLLIEPLLTIGGVTSSRFARG